MMRPLLHFSRSPSCVRLAISSRSHSANSSCIASPKRLPVSSRATSFTPSSPEILVPQKPVEPGPEQPVALLGKHDVYGPTLRQLHHSPQAGPVRIRAAVAVVHGLLYHSVVLTS